MEELPNGLALELPPGVFPLSTDSMLLAYFCRNRHAERWLDLGSGGATLGLLLCADDLKRHITGVESDRQSHEAATQNIARNALASRIESICADLGEVPSLFPAGSFSACVSNPPYYSGGEDSRKLAQARKQLTCTPETLCRSAAWALRYSGELNLVCPPEALAQWIAAGSACGLTAKGMCLARHREGGKISLVLLRLRKGGRPGLTLTELALHHADGSPTQVYKEIYHLI